MPRNANEATSLIIQILNMANPHPPEKAIERVEQMRELLKADERKHANDPPDAGDQKGADAEDDEKKKRGRRGGHDRQERGGRDRSEE